jgi:hypothetical protein
MPEHPISRFPRRTAAECFARGHGREIYHPGRAQASGLLYLDAVLQVQGARPFTTRPILPGYLRTTISDEQRREFGHLVEDTIKRIESAQFLAHSGIRFPQNPCSMCPYVGLCLGRKDLAEATLVRSHSGEDSEQNLITLCSGCHAEAHERLIR